MKHTNKNPFSWYFRSNLLLRILIGLVLGVIAGMIFREKILWVEPLGTLLVRLLTMIVLPLVISTLVVGAASVSPKRLGSAGVKIMVFYVLTSGLAVVLGLLFANLFQPGTEVKLNTTGELAKAVQTTPPSLMDTFLEIVPTNIFQAVANGDMLAVIFFMLLFGLGLSFLRASSDERLKQTGETLFIFFDGASEISQMMVGWIMQYAPIGVFALIAVVFGKQDPSIIGSLARVLMTTYAGFVCQIVIVYSIFLLLCRLSPMRFFSKARAAILTAFVTRSSGGTLPISMHCCDEMGVKRSVSSFTLPLGATINMDGTAIYQGVCTFFIAAAVGAPLSFDQQITVVITSVLVSIGTAGTPGAGVIMLMIVLKSVGLDPEHDATTAAAYAMILGLDAALDMGRTAVNVTGDLVGTVIVSKNEKEFELEQYNFREMRKYETTNISHKE